MIDTYTALTMTHLIVGLPLIVWIMISFFEDVPVDLEEAAFVDGASRLTTFFRIVLPVSRPGIAAASILAFIFRWNQFLFSLVLSGPETLPVPVAVFNFISYGQIDFGGSGATAVLITLPVVLLTLFSQRYIVSGLTMGAVKGWCWRSAAAAGLLLQLTARGGRYCQLSLYGKPVQLDQGLICYREIIMIGSNATVPRAWPRALQLLYDGTIPWHRLITHRFPLAGWESALQMVRSKAGVKVLLNPACEILYRARQP